MTIEYRNEALSSKQARAELARLMHAGLLDADKAHTSWLWEVANGEIWVKAK